MHELLLVAPLTTCDLLRKEQLPGAVTVLLGTFLGGRCISDLPVTAAGGRVTSRLCSALQLLPGLAASRQG